MKVSTATAENFNGSRRRTDYISSKVGLTRRGDEESVLLRLISLQEDLDA